MPLGPKDITPLEMATAYATFANDGLQVDPIFIERVEDSDGTVLFENTLAPERDLGPERPPREPGARGQRAGWYRHRARLENQVAAGKTGTAQDFSDAWFVGYTRISPQRCGWVIPMSRSR